MPPMIELRNVVKDYGAGSATRAVDDVSLAIHPGQVTLLMGPSGSGKTTLISIMGAILRPTSGQVWIDGAEISQWDESQLPAVRLRHIGFIFQSFNLVPTLSVIENVELALGLKQVRGAEANRLAKELLHQVGLSAKAHRRPADLSGGEKQRVAIARALAGNPSVVLADEPTAALDSVSGRVVMETLRAQAAQGRAVLIVTHDSRSLPYADRVIKIEDGRIQSDSLLEPAPPMPPQPVTAQAKIQPNATHEETAKMPLTANPAGRRRRWLYALPVLMVLALGTAFWLQKTATTAAANVPPASNLPKESGLQPVSRGNASGLVSGAGRVEPASEEVKISSPSPGRLALVAVEEGQHLRAGDMIARLDNAELAARVAQAQANVQLQQAMLTRMENGSSVFERQAAAANVTEAQALLASARSERDKRRALLESGDSSWAEYDRYERDVLLAQARLEKANISAASVNSVVRSDDRAQAQARLQAAKAELAEAQALLGKSMIRAPFAGVVLKRYRRSGEDAGVGPIISFGDTSRLVVRVDVDEADVGKVKVGDRAYVTAQAFGAKRFAGVVSHVGGQLGRKNIETGDPTEKMDTRVLETLITLDGHPDLPVGMRVDSFILVGATKERDQAAPIQ